MLDSVERAKAAGGTFGFDTMDVMEFGRMAVGEDAAGVSYGIWQPNQHIGFGICNEPGTVSWNELHTRDFDGAKKFYSTVFGWEYGDISTPDMSYAILRRSGEENGIGGLYLDNDMPPDVPGNWLVWFSVASCDESTTQATELGSAVFMPPTDSPFGRMSVVQAPQGEVFGLIDLRHGGRRAAEADLTDSSRRPIQSAGGMFWLWRKKLVGSHTRFNAARRAYFSEPYAAAMRPWPSSPMKLR